jgi:hypothetical protein
MRRMQPAAIAVIALTAMLWASRGNVSEARVERVTFEVLAPAGSRLQTNIDSNPPSAGSPGDWGVIRTKAISVTGCKHVGGILSRFVLITGGADPELIVDSSLNGAQGKLTVYLGGKSSALNKKGLDGAVTGGTGRYRDARGQVTVKDGVTRCGRKGILYSFDLLLKDDAPAPAPTKTVTVTPSPSPTPTFTSAPSPNPSVPIG